MPFYYDDQDRRLCPICNLRPEEHVALEPIIMDGAVILPHEYGVCHECYLEQRKRMYPKETEYPPPAPQRLRRPA